MDVKTISIRDELNIDIDSDGKIYGIELLNAGEQKDFRRVSILLLLMKQKIKKTEIQIS